MHKIILILLPVLLVIGELNATEYFVNKRDNDADNGLSREKAFVSIRNWVDALQAGDTLTVGPGEYFQKGKRGMRFQT